MIRVARRGFGDKSWTHNGELRVSEEDVSPLDDENSLYVQCTVILTKQTLG